jgi:hypothetical protein
MSSQFSRKVFPIAAATLLWAGGMSGTAAAKECTTDADCGAGYQCNPFGSASGSGGSTGTASDPGSGGATGETCAPGTNCTKVSVPPALPIDAGAAPPLRSADAGLAVPVPAPLPDAGTPVPAPSVTGVCGPKPIVCKTVADCPSADFDCVKDYATSPAPPCTQGQKCETPAPQESETGTCSAKPRACSTAADCPAPLTCQSQGSKCSGSASVGPDGVVTRTPETCTPGPSVCTWLPTVCTQDSDCSDPLYQCVKVSEYGMCSGAAPACMKGDGGGICPAPEPPTCTTVVTKNCMPKPIDCGLGQACPSGWSCFDFSNFGAGERPAWSITATDSACWPDGIILAAQGHAAGGGGSSTTRDGSGTSGAVDLGLQPPTIGKGDSSGSNGSVTGPTQAPVTPASTTGQSTGTGTDTAVAPRVKEGGGCAFGGGKTGSLDLGLALALMGLAVQLARRRNASR